MQTKTLWIVIALIVLIALGAYALTANRVAAPQGAVQEGGAAAGSQPAMDIDTVAATVTMTDDGFSPATVTVKVGDTVRFLNNSSRGMWVGADDHPTHTSYDGTSTREHCVDGAATGGTFDQCAQAPVGEAWEYTFTKAGTFGYHNHVGASLTGTIVVK